MPEYPYWHKQLPGIPLYPDVEWNRPEQRTMAGKLAIIGGTSHGFVAVADAYAAALDSGAGNVRAVVPAGLKRAIPPHITDIVYAATTPSGSIAPDPVLDATLAWSQVTLLVGDSGRSSETAIAFERLLRLPTPLVITRDAVDLLRQSSQVLVNREHTGLVLSFAQLQKLFQTVYYPKILSFSMPLNLLVETLHKFTLTYPIWLATFHHNQLIVAQGGDVTSTVWDQPMQVWRGITATRAACYWMWNPTKPLQAVTASLYS